MLDKSIPYKSICMRLPAQALQRLPSPTLPEGYSFEFYRPGRMADWGAHRDLGAGISLRAKGAGNLCEGLFAL